MDVGIVVEVDVDMDRYFGCLNGFPSQLNGIEAVTVLTLGILK